MSGFGEGPPPDTSKGNWKTLVSMTPEQSAAWLSNPEDNPWLAHVSDPQLRAKIQRQQDSLRPVIIGFAERAVKAMRSESAQTAARLDELVGAAKQGDPRATRLMLVMLAELMNTAFVELR